MKLTLAKEALRELTDYQLGRVIGASGFCQQTGVCHQTGYCEFMRSRGCVNSLGCRINSLGCRI